MTRYARTSGLKAFTLVEILIVVVILGIIAAIIVPQFVSAADDAKEASLLSTIKILRRQIALYRVEHNGNGPHVGPPLPLVDIERLDSPFPRLTERTDIAGNLDPNGPYGPYINDWPGNPFCEGPMARGVLVGHGAKPPRNGLTGWYYDLDTGIISANSLTGGESSDPE